jgi:hypothetical protein
MQLVILLGFGYSFNGHDVRSTAFDPSLEIAPKLIRKTNAYILENIE